MNKNLCIFEQTTERVDGLANFRCVNCGRPVYRCRSEAAKIYADCRRPTAKSPTWLGMAASAAAAAGNFVASGGKTVSGDAFAARMDQCRACPAFDPTLQRCNECGCFLSLKAWLPDEKCPLNKWPEIT